MTDWNTLSDQSLWRRLTWLGTRRGPSSPNPREQIGELGVDPVLLEKWHVFRSFRKRYRLIIGVLVCVLGIVASYAYWELKNLRHDTGSIDGQILKLETKQAATGEDYLQIGQLIQTLIHYEARAREIQKSLSTQVQVRDPQEAFVEQEINTLMKEFGAEEYSIPTEFIQQVGRYIKRYQDGDRDMMARALIDERAKLERMRQILKRENLPEDLAYMALVESGFVRSSSSQEGAAGLWQFTEETARSYGMKVNESVDDRFDLAKSTEGASRYIRELILDFGSGSSVMLAMAAYNSGPEKVRRAVRSVKDPIKQRNFWYLYRTRALPEETREYVPKVFAAIIIGRNPQQFGF